jgi:hypothetical protein
MRAAIHAIIEWITIETNINSSYRAYFDATFTRLT